MSAQAHHASIEQIQARMADSPVPRMLENLRAANTLLLSADARALKRKVGFWGRLLGRDLELAAEAEHLRSALHAQLAQAGEIEADTRHYHQRLLDDAAQLQAMAAAQPSADADAHAAKVALGWNLTAGYLRQMADNTEALLRRFGQVHTLLQPLLAQETALAAGGRASAAMREGARELAALQSYISAHARLPDTATPEPQEP